MPEPQLQYNIFDLGFNKHLSRETPLILGELGLASLMGSSFYESSPNIYEGTMNNIPTKSISGAFDSSGNVITELINEKLNTQTKEILGDFTFGTSGAIKIITDADNGIWISPDGILGKKAGATTFAITKGGDATFAGELSAAYGTFGTITIGTLEGAVTLGGRSGTILALAINASGEATALVNGIVTEQKLADAAVTFGKVNKWFAGKMGTAFPA